MNDFSLLIAQWYRLNGRKLPWRKTRDPYKIWLSEVILQQTRVDQGLSYYQKFITHYPTVKDLASANEQSILNDWQGLGYYSRARNLHKTAQQVSDEFLGEFPKTYVELIKLKGIGPYSAAAISSFAFNEKRAVVDGNVYRVLSRVFNCSEAVDSSAGKTTFQTLADELISSSFPGEHNQAIMELGALICLPKNPKCFECPVELICEARRLNNYSERPVKLKKTKTRDRYFHYFVHQWDGKLIVKKRIEKDVWQHMYDFPLLETTSENYPQNAHLADYSSPVQKHVLSHQKIYAIFHHFKKEPIFKETNWKVIHREELNDLPLPRLIDKYISEM